MHLRRPTTEQPHYGEHLGDVEYWSPYVAAVLERHDLPADRIEAPFIGTFPTFLAGDVVVKLFADTFDGARSFAAERAMCELVRSAPGIPAPELLGSGQLFDPGDRWHWHWPYLITERIAGTAIREASATAPIAGQLGAAVAQLHRLTPPAVVAARDLLPSLRSEATPRQCSYGMPDHLALQIPDYLAGASTERVLVHADLTADHAFVDSTGLVGIIDWGDAIAADPWYELVAIHFDCLRADSALFAEFLEGYGWSDAPEFPQQALRGVLEFQLDVISTIAKLVDLNSIATLDELAHQLFSR